MLNVFFIWFLKLFYNTRNNFKILQRVLRIKIKTPMKIVDNKKGTDKERSNKFHLALRLNNDQSEELSKQAPLFELIEYVHKAFNTKYLTIIVGPAGFEREIEEVNVGNDISSIDQTAQIQISLYHNYQLIYSPLTPDINVNLIDDNDDMHSHSDSRSLFLLKLREFLYSDSEKVKVMSEIYEAALKNFTSKKEKVNLSNRYSNNTT